MRSNICFKSSDVFIVIMLLFLFILYSILYRSVFLIHYSLSRRSAFLIRFSLSRRSALSFRSLLFRFFCTLQIHNPCSVMNRRKIFLKQIFCLEFQMAGIDPRIASEPFCLCNFLIYNYLHIIIFIGQKPCNTC